MNLCFSVFIGENIVFPLRFSILSRKMSGKTGKLCGKLGDFGGNTWNIIGSKSKMKGYSFIALFIALFQLSFLVLYNSCL